MQIVVRTATAEAELDVLVDERAGVVTVGDVVARVTRRSAPPTVRVDGRLVPSTTPMVAAGFRRASVVDLTAGSAPTVPAADVEVAVVAGVGTGRRRPLGHGRYRLGPGRGAGDLSDGVVEEVAVELTTARPVRVDLDDRVVIVRRTGGGRGVAAPAGVDGAIAFNRPPRPAAEPAPPAIDVPAGGREAGEPRRFPLLALAAPLPVAVAIASLLGEWRYLLFGLLSPVMLLANWIEDRRTRTRDRRRAAAADAGARRALRAELAHRHAADVERARRGQPDLAELIGWAERGAPRLWERRRGDDDAFTVAVGVGDRAWRPVLKHGSASIDDADDLVAELGPLQAVPVVADLSSGGIGVVGARRHAAAAGILLTAVATHGPADLGVLVLAEGGRAAAWEWTKWLPHAVVGAVVDDPATARDVVTGAAAGGATRGGPPGGPLVLVVADGDRWWRERHAPLRGLLHPGSAVRVLALADDTDRLPAVCSTIVDAGAHGRGHAEHVDRRELDDAVAPLLVDDDVALGAARALARFDDPERFPGAVPSTASSPTLIDLLDIDPDDAAAVVARWRRPDRRAATPLGVGPAGPVTVDLVADGPHGLVAGTTGSGKSELLRSLVAGLAATLPPDELNLVLVDFKGGAAFDACADLPHTVGLVTDLDEHLAGRVLRCLRAELSHRERVLRAAGASALDELGRPGLLPRLLLVIDEFASLSAQLPEFVPGLVEIAQRGRSLGFHLVLATQRPAGVVDQRIRANTDLRIALRMQDEADSVDVVGVRDAAAIPRTRPGRALARFAAGELVELQTALTGGAGGRRSAAPLTVRPFVHHRPPTALERRVAEREDDSDGDGRATGARVEPSDLRRIVRAIAAAAADRPAPRRPYLDPLPAHLSASDLGAAERAGDVPFALVDRPDEQRRTVRGWRPGTPLAVFGAAGAGATSLLATLVVGLAGAASPDDAHVYVVDADAGALAPLAALAHVGAVVRVDERDRLARLAALLVREVDRRRRKGAAALAGEPSITLLVDNVGSLRQALEQDRHLGDVWPAFERVLRDGPALGVGAVVTAHQERALPATAAAQIAERLVMRLADRHAYAAFGFRTGAVPTMVPGRALCPQEGLELQIVAPAPDLAAAVAAVARRPAQRPPARVDELPAVVAASTLVDRARRSSAGWLVPLGLDLRDGGVAGLPVRPGTTVVVTGPARSGRSSVLAVVAAGIAAAERAAGVAAGDRAAAIFAVGPRLGRLGPHAIVPGSAAAVAGWVDRLAAGTGPRVVLVDDADALAGPSFERLAAARDGAITFVVAGTSEGLRAIGHWSRPLLRTRTGVLLAPTAADGDLLGVTVPSRGGRVAPGHGYLVVDGEPVPVRCAVPDRSAGVAA